ncbi:MAG: dienelactone hydrolase family protein [Thermoplasmata archaeon]
MRDDDRLLNLPDVEFGSGVIGVCDVCGVRQAVIVLQKERFKLCVLDFLNKTWTKTKNPPGAPLPPYRSERTWFPTAAVPAGRAPALLLSPTRPVRHPIALVTPDLYGITTSLLDAAIRLAKEGFEVMIPDLSKTEGIGPGPHWSLRAGVRFRGGLPASSPAVRTLTGLYADALRTLREREMVDPSKTALVGLSYGGALATVLASEEASIGALAVAYPVPLNPPELPRLVTAPVFLALGGRDRVAARSRDQWVDARTATGVDLEILEIPGARGLYLSRDLREYDLPSAERTWSAMLAFLRARLLPPPPKPPAPRSAPDPLAPVVSRPSATPSVTGAPA